jgi:hypothetical protein
MLIVITVCSLGRIKNSNLRLIALPVFLKCVYAPPRLLLPFSQYDFTWFGFWTVVAIFSNFWSCWNLLNIYVTMVHQEDAVHRVYYSLHVMMSFVMCMACEHPMFSFFDFGYQGFFLVMASILCRFCTFAMWLQFAYFDGKMRANPDFAAHLPKYSREDVVRQVKKHAGSILGAMVVFAVTAGMVYEGDPKDDTRRALATSYSSSYSSYGCRRLGEEGANRELASSYSAYGCGDDTYAVETDTGQYTVVIVLWILAVLIEQCGNIHACVFDKLPFSGAYCGERMQSWLMLCFGESVIGLLINPLYYDSITVKSILAAFVMVFCLCAGYFDVTDADKFLHLFMLRGERKYAFCYCIGQCVFSLFVFLVGVAVKSIVYVNNATHDLEVLSGCVHPDESFRRRLSWTEGGQLDQIAAGMGDQFKEHFNMFGALKDQPAFAHASSFSMLVGGGASGEGHRRLASWTLDQYDDLLFKCFLLLVLATLFVQVSSVAVAYCMPTDQDMKKVHVSRLGAIAIAFVGLVIPYSLKSIKTECLGEYEASHRRRLSLGNDSSVRNLASSYSSSYSAYSSSTDYSDSDSGLSVTESLVVLALIVAVSFAVHCFSLDAEREHTYKELEEAAEHGRPPVLHTLDASFKKKSLADRGGVAFVAAGFSSPKVSPSPVEAGL